MDAKAATRERMLTEHDGLIALSHRIHANPEVAFEEERASRWVGDTLADAGFAMELGIYDLPTALRARFGSGPLQIAFCAEYDALPGIGHACGHNLIAAMAVGAAIATAAVADDLGVTVNVIGTPAEEVGNAGGKILLLERGAFDGMHAAMMVHPTPFDIAEPRLIAASMFDVHYTGKEAHPVASPTEGVNAADALLVAQVAIGLLRQHLRPTDNIHGITTRGGDAPNIIPAHTAARYVMRAENLDQLAELQPRIVNCFQAGALATGSTLEIVGGDQPYAEVNHDKSLASLYRRNAETLGRTFIESPMAASTDMGNISRVLPTLHPSIGLDSLPAVNHQPAFTAHCATEKADQALFDGALAMAWTVIDTATDEAVRARLLARS